MMWMNARSFAAVLVVASSCLASCSVIDRGGDDASSTTPGQAVDQATVVEVIDGDTIILEIAGMRESARLIGIDTPETKHPTKGVQCFGPEASQFLTGLLPAGTLLRVERDIEARDAYGRLLLYLFLMTQDGERFVNLELIARGFARPLSIAPNVRYQEDVVAAAVDAAQNRRGLWRACK